MYKFEFELTEKQSDLLFYALGLAAGSLKNRDWPEHARIVEEIFQKVLAGSTPPYITERHKTPETK